MMDFIKNENAANWIFHACPICNTVNNIQVETDEASHKYMRVACSCGLHTQAYNSKYYKTMNSCEKEAVMAWNYEDYEKPSCGSMCEKCATCIHRKYLPATWEEPAEEYCMLDMDEFYSEEEVDCDRYEEYDSWSREDYEADRFSWDDYRD